MIARAGIALSALLTATCLVGADVVLFDNFGPNDDYVVAGGWTLGSQFPSPNGAWQQGNGFAIQGGSDFYLESITAAITAVSGLNQATLSLYDSIDGQPGNLLEGVTRSNLPLLGMDAPPSEFSFSGNTLLEAGKTYWVIGESAVSAQNSSLMVWNQNVTVDVGLFASRRADDQEFTTHPGFTRGAMRVVGTPGEAVVPAPAVLPLLGLAGLVAVGGRRRTDCKNNPVSR